MFLDMNPMIIVTIKVNTISNANKTLVSALFFGPEDVTTIG